MMERGNDFRSRVIERKSLPLPNARVGTGAYGVGRRNADLGPRWDGGKLQWMSHRLLNEKLSASQLLRVGSCRYQALERILYSG